jgi:hypothetical protein
VSDYRLYDRANGVRSPAEAKDFSSRPAEAHPTSYPMGTGRPLPGVKSGQGVKLTTHSIPPPIVACIAVAGLF